MIPRLAACLAAACLIVFGPALRFDFVLDDHLNVTRNPMVREGLTAAGLRWAFTTDLAGHWHPLTWLSHMADAQLYGLRPAGHHATNLVLHAANVLLFFSLLQATTRAPWRSAFAAALFGLHPLRAESVAWVADRKDLLAAFFGLLALRGYSAAAAAGGARRAAGLAAALAGFGCSLLSKPALVALPLILPVFDRWPLRRGDSAGTPRAAGRWEKLPFFLLALAAAAATLWAVQERPAAGAASAAAWGRQALLALLVLAGYLGDCAWPRGLAVMAPAPRELAAWPLLLASLALVSLALAAARLRRAQPAVTSGLAWFALGILPVTGIVPGGPAAPADRYTYFPSMGLAIAAAWGLAAAAARLRLPPRAACAAAAALLLALAGLAALQTRTWRGPEELFRHARSVHRDDPVALHNLGAHLMEERRDAEASAIYRRILEIAPGFAAARLNLGVLCARGGDWRLAEEHYREALRLAPDLLEARYDLGSALHAQGRTEEAIAAYEEVLRRRPGHAGAHNNLGVMLLERGEAEAAVAHFREALRLQPGHAAARENLARATAAARP